jgi:hypothetical protein
VLFRSVSFFVVTVIPDGEMLIEIFPNFFHLIKSLIILSKNILHKNPPIAYVASKGIATAKKIVE